MTGFFIAMEGGEGAGKSTHSKLLANWLESLGYEVLLTREPGGTPTAEKIRNILLDPSISNMPNETEALLFAAARSDHAHNKIKPALDRGLIVICDRYIDSSVAYQGVARGLGADQIRDLSVWATESTLPDFTIYMDVPAEAAEQRMEGVDRMEIQSRDFHFTVHQAFRDMAAKSEMPNVLIDATGPKAQVEMAIREAVMAVLPKR